MSVPKVTVKDVHEVLLAMLKEIDLAASSSGATYYLAYGTALGAVREGDFIQWDTDADVLVPVQDYGLLLEELKRHSNGDFQVVEPGDASYEHLFARLSLAGLDHNLLHIDLFPLAGSSSTRLGRRLEVRIAKFINTAYMLKVADPRERYHYSAQRARLARSMQVIMGPIPRGLFAKVHSALGRRPTTDKAHVFNVSGSYGDREIVPSFYFGEPSGVRVRGQLFSAPREAQRYLAHTYGRYQEPPPERVRREALEFFDRAVAPRLATEWRSLDQREKDRSRGTRSMH